MRRATHLTGLTACLCLLAVQWSGLHRHADETGTIGAPEIAASHTHFHDHDHAVEHGGSSHAPGTGPGAVDADALHSHQHEHEHEDEREVSVLDLALGNSKLPVGILAHIAPFALPQVVDAPLRADSVDTVPIGRHIRWRPPLRAPPRAV